jgi:LAO/AO transport system kinase
MSTRTRNGGLAAAPFDAIRALDAFGKDVILVETIGSGQSEVEVVKAADSVCVVLLPSAGDDVQANKAGILEIADAFAVNKADLDGAGDVVRRLREMLDMGPSDGWQPPIVETVAMDGADVDELVDALDAHADHLRTDGRLSRRWQARFKHEATVYARERLLSRLDTAATLIPTILSSRPTQLRGSFSITCKSNPEI